MPRKRLPWIKLWFEMLGDPKMTRLSSVEKWYWIGILLLAGQSPIRGKLMLTDTEPMSMEDIAAALSLSPEEIPQLENCIAKLERLGSLIWNSNCLEVVHFLERQGPAEYVSEAKRISKEKIIKDQIVKHLWDNKWMPTGEEIVNVEREKRVGNLYIDIVAKTKTSLLLIEVKPFALYISHMGQVTRYLNTLREQTSLPILPFLIGMNRSNIDKELEESTGISVLTFSDLPFYVETTVEPMLSQRQLAPHREEEGRGEKKEITPLPKGKGARAKQTDPRVKEVFDEIHQFFGYPDKVQQDPIPNYAKEGQFIKKMLSRGFTCVEILACWRSKVSQRGGDYVSMVWVNEDIGKKGGAGGANRKHSVRPKSEEKWDPSKPLR